MGRLFTFFLIIFYIQKGLAVTGEENERNAGKFRGTLGMILGVPSLVDNPKESSISTIRQLSDSDVEARKAQRRKEREIARQRGDHLDEVIEPQVIEETSKTMESKATQDSSPPSRESALAHRQEMLRKKQNPSVIESDYSVLSKPSPKSQINQKNAQNVQSQIDISKPKLQLKKIEFSKEKNRLGSPLHDTSLKVDHKKDEDVLVHLNELKQIRDNHRQQHLKSMVGSLPPTPRTTFSTDSSKIHRKGNSPVPVLDIISKEKVRLKRETNPKILADHDIGWEYSNILPTLQSKVLLSSVEGDTKVALAGTVILAHHETLLYHVRLQKDGSVVRTKFADLLCVPVNTTVITYGLQPKLSGIKGVITDFDPDTLSAVVKDLKSGASFPNIGVENLLFLPTVGTPVTVKSKSELAGKVGVVTSNDYSAWMCNVEAPGFKTTAVSPYKLEPATSIPFWSQKDEVV